MYNYLKKLYNEGKLSAAGIENAVTKGWITEEEKNAIIGSGSV